MCQVLKLLPELVLRGVSTKHSVRRFLDHILYILVNDCVFSYTQDWELNNLVGSDDNFTVLCTLEGRSDTWSATGRVLRVHTNSLHWSEFNLDC